MTRISESELILPALYIINKYPAIKTSELIDELREILKPSGEDVEILHGRNDDKFSQIVRNLVSHHTLDKRYRYTIIDDENNIDTNHRITENGLDYLNANIQHLENLFSNDLDYSSIVDGISVIQDACENKKELLFYDENLIVSEGKKKSVTSNVYTRSWAFHDEAIKYYTRDDRIVCAVCGFDFYEKYGDLGSGYIELHHLKPIFQYEDCDFKQFFSEAIKGITPLCANCHRMIHRNRYAPISIDKLKNILNK